MANNGNYLKFHNFALKFEPVIQEGNEGLVHHIVLYACYGEMSDDSDGQAWDCIWNVMPDQHKCSTATFVWAVGGNVRLYVTVTVNASVTVRFKKEQEYIF